MKQRSRKIDFRLNTPRKRPESWRHEVITGEARHDIRP